MKSGMNTVIPGVLNVFRFLHLRKNKLYPLIMYDSKITLCNVRLICWLVAEKIEINLINVFPPLIIIHKKTNEKTSPTMLPYIKRKTYVINSCEIQHSNPNYDRFPAYFIQTKYAPVPGRFTL